MAAVLSDGPQARIIHLNLILARCRGCFTCRWAHIWEEEILTAFSALGRDDSDLRGNGAPAGKSESERARLGAVGGDPASMSPPGHRGHWHRDHPSSESGARDAGGIIHNLGASIAVVGAGLTAVQVVCKVASAAPQGTSVVLVTSKVRVVVG